MSFILRVGRSGVGGGQLSFGVRQCVAAMDDYDAVISPQYDRVIRKTLVAQVIVGILAALMLDGGTTARVDEFGNVLINL